MKVSEVKIGSKVQIRKGQGRSPSERFHEGQSMLVVDSTRMSNAGTLFVIECEDEHVFPVRASQLASVESGEEAAAR